MKKKRANEKKLASELREACQEAYNEQQSHNPHTAHAFLALARVVPRVANATPGWSGVLDPLTKPFFRRKGVH